MLFLSPVPLKYIFSWALNLLSLSFRWSKLLPTCLCTSSETACCLCSHFKYTCVKLISFYEFFVGSPGTLAIYGRDSTLNHSRKPMSIAVLPLARSGRMSYWSFYSNSLSDLHDIWCVASFYRLWKRRFVSACAVAVSILKLNNLCCQLFIHNFSIMSSQLFFAHVPVLFVSWNIFRRYVFLKTYSLLTVSASAASFQHNSFKFPWSTHLPPLSLFRGPTQAVLIRTILGIRCAKLIFLTFR